MCACASVEAFEADGRRLDFLPGSPTMQGPPALTNRAQQLGLRRFLIEEEATARAWLSNVQTRQLAGASCADLTDNDPDLLEVALANLKRCDLVGLVERLDETLLLLGQMMGWGCIGPMPHLNDTPFTGTDEESIRKA